MRNALLKGVALLVVFSLAATSSFASLPAPRSVAAPVDRAAQNFFASEALINVMVASKAPPIVEAEVHRAAALRKVAGGLAVATLYVAATGMSSHGTASTFVRTWLEPFAIPIVLVIIGVSLLPSVPAFLNLLPEFQRKYPGLSRRVQQRRWLITGYFMGILASGGITYGLESVYDWTRTPRSSAAALATRTTPAVGSLPKNISFGTLVQVNGTDTVTSGPLNAAQRAYAGSNVFLNFRLKIAGEPDSLHKFSIGLRIRGAIRSVTLDNRTDTSEGVWHEYLSSDGANDILYQKHRQGSQNPELLVAISQSWVKDELTRLGLEGSLPEAILIWPAFPGQQARVIGGSWSVGDNAVTFVQNVDSVFAAPAMQIPESLNAKPPAPAQPKPKPRRHSNSSEPAIDLSAAFIPLAGFLRRWRARFSRGSGMSVFEDKIGEAAVRGLRLDLSRVSLSLHVDPEVLHYDFSRYAYFAGGKLPQKSLTGMPLREWVQDDPDILAAMNGGADNLMTENSLVVVDGTLMQREAPGVRSQTRHSLTGWYSFFVLDNGGGIRDVHLEEGEPSEGLPFRTGISGAVLIRNYRDVSMNVTQAAQNEPNLKQGEVLWNPISERLALSVLAKDRSGDPLLISVRGDPNDKTDPTLNEVVQYLLSLGVEDAIYVGASADVQQYVRGEKEPFLLAKPRLHSDSKGVFPNGRPLFTVLTVRHRPTPAQQSIQNVAQLRKAV